MTRILTSADVASVLTLRDAIDAVEVIFRDFGAGRVARPETLGLKAELGTFHVKAARAGVFAAKINANFPGNPKAFGLPTIQGVIIVMDLERGTPLGILDSSLITTLRTAAATAVAAKYLSRRDARTAAIIGCGIQGRANLEALLAVRDLARFAAWDVDPRVREEFAEEMSGRTGTLVTAAGSLDEAVGGADIIVTCTTSPSPLLEARHARPGVFIAAVGADNPGKCEIAPDLMARAVIVPDILEQAAAMGDLRHAIEAGCVTRGDVRGELGDVLCGRAPGRTSPDELIVFDSTGSALQDVAVASLALTRAGEASIGLELSLA